MDSCVFCNYKNGENGTIILENEHCTCIELKEEILIGSCIIIPKAHKKTVFDLSQEEWMATKLLLDKVKQYLDARYKPDGYNVGWNVGKIGGQEVFHAHMHIIPRYSDEPHAGKGIRHWIKQEDNKR